MITEELVARVVHTVRPPTWREEPLELHFVLLKREASGPETLQVYEWAQRERLRNARVISPRTLSWSSLFHPRFFQAMRNVADAVAITQVACLAEGLLKDRNQRQLFWLQSVAFLAAVTLSAAIVQGRWSKGTLASKYDRLWQIAELLDQAMADECSGSQIRDNVRELALHRPTLKAIDRLLVIRGLFERVISALVVGERADAATIRVVHNHKYASRFGFLDLLREAIPSLETVIVYGSSVTSEDFADFDVVLVVCDPEQVLRDLCDSALSWQGKELNLSVYSKQELWRMQLLSGDNLAGYGLCIYGEAELPEKPAEMLLARNLSFGMVRLRQQLGMVSHALTFEPSADDDKRNLYQYFVKIPANVAKGTFGAVGQRLSKDEVHRWLIATCDFDTAEQQSIASAGQIAAALSSAAVATSEAMERLNGELRILA